MKRVAGIVGFLMLAALMPAVAPAAQAQSSRSIQILHVVPNGITPRFGDMNVRIPATVDAVQGFLQDDVGRTLRFDPGVTVVPVQNGSAESMRDQLLQAGYNDGNKVYLVFAESAGANIGRCGVTLAQAADEPRFSFLLMPACDIYPAPAAQAQWPFDATYLVLHELIHALDAVQSCAPNEGLGGHVLDSGFDVIFLGARSPEQWANLTIDVNNDDYYGHSIDGCIDIEDSPYWASAAPAGRMCRGLRVTIDMTTGASGTGTPGNDVIFGTIGADTIQGLGGDDSICAGPGDDVVDGGEGNDRIFGAQGNDELSGGNGDDILHGNQGNDLLDGGTGADRLFGYAGNDTIFGGPGADRLHGNFGNDIIRGGSGDDRIYGYGDNDTLIGNDGNDIIGGNRGNDLIEGRAGNDTLYGSDGNDIVRGGEGNDDLAGNSGNDEVYGEAGSDSLDGGVGIDVCGGGADRDIRAGRCEQVVSVP